MQACLQVGQGRKPCNCTWNIADQEIVVQQPDHAEWKSVAVKCRAHVQRKQRSCATAATRRVTHSEVRFVKN